jgi:hypothetical protein
MEFLLGRSLARHYHESDTKLNFSCNLEPAFRLACRGTREASGHDRNQNREEEIER